MISDQLVGVVAMLLAACVAPPQLIKILWTREVRGISVWSYILLEIMLGLYIVHATYIQDFVFTVVNMYNFTMYGTILYLMWRLR